MLTTFQIMGIVFKMNRLILNTRELPNLNQEDIHSLNMSSNKENPGTRWTHCEFYKTLKKGK